MNQNIILPYGFLEWTDNTLFPTKALTFWTKLRKNCEACFTEIWMSPAHFRVYYTSCLFCSSFTLDPIREPMEITFQWIFALIWLPRAMDFILIPFSAAACSYWMKVTRAILLPSIDVSNMVLNEHLNALCIFIWIIALLQATKMIDLGTLNKKPERQPQPTFVSFAFGLGSLHLCKLLFVFGFHIIWKLFPFRSLFQIIGLCSPHMSSTLEHLACWMMQTDGLGCTWIAILPHNLNFSRFTFCLFITLAG